MLCFPRLLIRTGVFGRPPPLVPLDPLTWLLVARSGPRDRSARRAGKLGSGREKGRRAKPNQLSLATPHEVPQETTALLPARLTAAQDSLDEPTPPLATRAAAPLPPQDG